MPTKRVDPEPILKGLKDFQRSSVEYVFQRMYLDSAPAHRFLLADEVGLGKTLVARGLVAKAIDHLWPTVDRIDIIYICSNHDIARQNINRLNVTGEQDAVLPSRITELPLTVHGLKSRKLNFITFTPSTSFDLRSQLGTAKERALLYWMLKHVWDIRGPRPMNVLQGHASRESFRRRLDGPEQKCIDRDLLAGFGRALELHIQVARSEGKPDIRSRFDELCDRLGALRSGLSKDENAERSRLIGELRSVLAASCLEALEPDLVILDEFQRFKHLLEPTDEASELARDLFEYENARVLLLSATPYKMYTITDEAEGEDHYADFLRTLGFLEGNPGRTQEFAGLLQEYRREILRIADGSVTRLQELRDEIQRRLRRVMIRTERLSVTDDRSGMLKHMDSGRLALQAPDLDAYIGLARIGRALMQSETVEYWKSSPYPLSFMDRYRLKEKLRESEKDEECGTVVRETLQSIPSLLLDDRAVSQYGAIDPCNARMRSLISETLDHDQWRLLWLPPSLPYYKLGGPYAIERPGFPTKRLVFSSWMMVPKAIACLLSYEADRRMVRLAEEHPDYSPEARKKKRPLLRFAKSDGRLTGMPVLGLLYPSVALSTAGDPLVLAASTVSEELPSMDDLLTRVEDRIRVMLAKLTIEIDTPGPPDETWYWAAPILLDRMIDPNGTRDWITQSNLAQEWYWADQDQAEEDVGEVAGSRWVDHIKKAQLAFADPGVLGPQPPDLAKILALMAIAGPGVVALRAMRRMGTNATCLRSLDFRNAAGKIAWGFIQLFNVPEVMALVRDTYKEEAEEAYWVAVLRYCAEGGIQSVLDEYAHALYETHGLFSKQPNEAVKDLAQRILEAMGLRTAVLGVDVRKNGSRTNGLPLDGRTMRVRFALQFGKQEADEGKGAARADQVRSAFNSPFWPFVLATTSVGQEGLDFHLYCHAVVHWNLPANPVDLEQREGRVHRYKGHAIRKNLATRYGIPAEAVDGRDPWKVMFQKALIDRAPGVSDIVPFWVYPITGGAQIERHVPLFPLSREADRMISLRRSLAVYRMVFGQVRQEELVEYLIGNMKEEEIERAAKELIFDLSPPTTSLVTGVK